MGFQIHYRKYAWEGLESKHSLVIGLILPCRAVDYVRALVLAGMVPMDMTGHENIGNRLDDHLVLRLGGKWGLSPP